MQQTWTSSSCVEKPKQASKTVFQETTPSPLGLIRLICPFAKKHPHMHSDPADTNHDAAEAFSRLQYSHHVLSSNPSIQQIRLQGGSRTLKDRNSTSSSRGS